jgi:transglutaminase-like putative cysteine protease
LATEANGALRHEAEGHAPDDLPIRHRRFAQSTSVGGHAPQQPHPFDRVEITVLPPAAEIDWAQDVFGNLIATTTFSQTTTELIITAEAVVVQDAAAWPVFRISPGAHSYPFEYLATDKHDLGALAKPEQMSRTVAAWARGFVRGTSTDTLSLLKDINTGMLDRIVYRVRDEEGTQSAAETLIRASGSCRDFAELFIQAVRHLGFGARAVSGYLYDPNAAPTDAGSTHAWAEVFLPGAGWIAFDPTQQRVGEANLIPVAVAHSNKQVVPVVGSYVGSPEDFIGMEVTVHVTPV